MPDLIPTIIIALAIQSTVFYLGVRCGKARLLRTLQRYLEAQQRHVDSRSSQLLVGMVEREAEGRPLDPEVVWWHWERMGRRDA